MATGNMIHSRCRGIFAALALLPATAAFAALPSGYMEFEYIQGNGIDARIITDYTPKPNQDKIEAVVSFPSGTLDKNQAIWCARGADSRTKTYTLFALKDSSDNKYKFRFDYYATPGTFCTPALVADDGKYTVTADGNVFTWSGGTGQTHDKVADFTAAGGPLVLFYSYTSNSGNDKQNFAKHKLYSVKVWRSDALIHDFVPSMRLSDYAAGLYDVTSNKFYAGTGTLTLMDHWDASAYVAASGYVAASPDEAKSDASSFVSFLFNKKETAPMESIFKSTKPLGFTLIVR